MPKRLPSAPPSAETELVTRPATNMKASTTYGPYLMGRGMWIPGNGTQHATLEMLRRNNGKSIKRSFLLRVGDQIVCFPASTGKNIAKTIFKLLKESHK